MAKVLLVEDDNNLREIFQMRLQAEGYNALTAADGEEGLVVAMKEKPELIVADVMMPKLSGFEMIENLRSAPEMKNTKVIMMTALGQAEDQARGEKLGVVKYLVKSQVTLEDFARVVKEVLGPGDPSAAAAAPKTSSSATNNQESESNMPEDTSSNPAPASSDVPASEPAAPAGADMSTPAAMPAADSAQQSTADEQSAVQDQINNFAASAPAEPAAAGSDTGAPAMPPASEPPAVPETEAPAAPSEPAAPAPSDGESSGGTTPDATTNAL